jgi:hypothetical protein
MDQTYWAIPFGNQQFAILHQERTVLLTPMGSSLILCVFLYFIFYIQTFSTILPICRRDDWKINYTFKVWWENHLSNSRRGRYLCIGMHILAIILLQMLRAKHARILVDQKPLVMNKSV